MTTDEYADRVRAWAAELRAGATETWTRFVDDTAPSPAPPGIGPLPGAAQLEVVRRLAEVPDVAGLPDFAGLADLVLGTPGPGRGLVDVPLPWPGATTDATATGIGTPPVAPEALPAEELLRVCTGVLVRLLAEEPRGPERRASRPWRPWRKGFTLLGAPTTVDLVRGALLAGGLREGGGSRTTYLVLGGPLDELMAQRWSARVRAGAALRWQRMWRIAETHDRVPPGIALPTVAAHLADEFDPARVHVVVAPDTDTTLGLVGEVLGVTLEPIGDRYDDLATDLLRRVNPVLTLAVGDGARRELVSRVWPEIADGEPSGPLAVPARQLDWAVATGERMASMLDGARYAVHGDPAVVVPTPRPGARRGPRPDDVLAHALRVIGRAWARHHASAEASAGATAGAGTDGKGQG